MRILKTKIVLAQKRKDESFLRISRTLSGKIKQINQLNFCEGIKKKNNIPKASLSLELHSVCSTSASSNPSVGETPRRKNSSGSQELQVSNNIMKNYCRGIINFSLSRLAISYLLPLLKKHQVELESFRRFIQAKKSKINCIKQLRQMLLVTPNDNAVTASVKSIFKDLTIIFLKFFAPNWIYNTKIIDKFAHLKFRFKILRRVKEPLYFTYLQGFDNY